MAADTTDSATDSRLVSILAAYCERAEQITATHADEDCDLNGETCTGHDAVRMADGYSALLALASQWDQEAERADALAEQRPSPADIMLFARAQAHNDCASALRVAITAALTGEGATS